MYMHMARERERLRERPLARQNVCGKIERGEKGVCIVVGHGRALIWPSHHC